MFRYTGSPYGYRKIVVHVVGCEKVQSDVLILNQNHVPLPLTLSTKLLLFKPNHRWESGCRILSEEVKVLCG